MTWLGGAQMEMRSAANHGRRPCSVVTSAAPETDDRKFPEIVERHGSRGRGPGVQHTTDRAHPRSLTQGKRWAAALRGIWIFGEIQPYKQTHCALDAFN